MAAVDLGSSVTVTWLSSPSGTISATVSQPDGTPFTGPVTITQANPATAQFVPTVPGRHAVRMTSTGAAVGAYQDIVNVWPADDRAIISLQDAMDALSASSMPPGNLNDLRIYVTQATDLIEDYLGGPVVYTTKTVRFDGGKTTIVLPGEVQSIVSVTEIGYPVSLYVYDETANTLTAGTVVAPRRFMPSVRGIVVTYTAGFLVIPPSVILAARELVRHLWQVGKQGFRPVSAMIPGDDTFAPSSFALPRRVTELLDPYRRKAPGGFA